MNVLFVHDHSFVRIGTEVYSTGGLPSSVWQFYKNNIDDNVYVFARNLKAKHGNVLSSSSNVYFELSKYYQTPLDYFTKKNKIKSEIKYLMSKMDLAIIRLPSFLGFLAIDVCLENKIPYAVEVVGNAFESYWYYGSIKGKFLAHFAGYKTKKEVARALFAKYVTKDYLQRLYPNFHYTTYASNVEINQQPYNVLESRLKKISAKGKSEIIIIGMIGNVNVSYKGYDVLFKAVKCLQDEGIKVRVEIAGGGSPKTILELAKKLNIKERIKHLGVLNRQEIFIFLQEIDFYIHPSRLEGLPRSVVEAMSVATPVLASNVGGIPELIDSKFLHNPGDHHKLYQDLKLVIQNKELQIEMAKENWEHAKDYEKSILDKKKFEFIQAVVDSIKR